MTPADPEELLALPPRRDEIDRILGEVFAQIAEDFYSPPRIEERAQAFREAREVLLEGLEGMKNLAKNAEHQAAAAYGDLVGKKNMEEKILEKLDEINRKISSSAVKDVAGFLFPSPGDLETQLESPPEEPLKRYLELSTKLYRALGAAAEYNLSVLRAFPPKGLKK
jgi:hypothetical protein